MILRQGCHADRAVSSEILQMVRCGDGGGKKQKYLNIVEFPRGRFSKEKPEGTAGGIRDLEDWLIIQGRERQHFRIRSMNTGVETRQPHKAFS